MPLATSLPLCASDIPLLAVNLSFLSAVVVAAMRRRDCGLLPALVVVALLSSTVVFSAEGSGAASPWQTLTGDEPAVIARGGFSGMFPDSSEYAYSFAIQTSTPNVILWCDLQLTKDGQGICLPDVVLDNSTGVSNVYPRSENSSHFFSVDFTLKQLAKVPLVQGVFSRTNKFDGVFPIVTLDGLLSMKPPRLWLNFQNDLFYSQHNLSLQNYLLSVSKKAFIDFVSSPEVNFLRNAMKGLKTRKTKLIFHFLENDKIEPSTNQTYGALLKNLTFVNSFASGILIPKNYIWPATEDLYLLPFTTVVTDSHRLGLEVFASDFSNDGLLAYNYSYDPLAEYLSFVDNGNFSVDGVLSDHPLTASEAIGCFSHLNKSALGTGKTIVISHNGASGIFPGCTDLAYKQAIDDGADFIDCSVQVTKDGVPICMNSINLLDGTDVATSKFGLQLLDIPQIQGKPGVFTFNLTWDEIQKNLKPVMSNPYFDKYKLLRNPANRNAGKFVSLDDFLALAKGSHLTGVLINIEHAAFSAENLGYSLTDLVLKALDLSGYNETTQKVLIQSSNSSVLVNLRQRSKYNLVYKVDELVGDASESSIQDIRTFAHSVAIDKQSIFPTTEAFTTGQSGLAGRLQSSNLSVYVYLLANEYVSQPWDYFSDPYVEVNNFVQGASVDGVITDYPATASAYRRNTCLKGTRSPSFMLPVQPGGLLSLMSSDALPPAQPPLPPLTESDVVEPPLPATANISSPSEAQSPTTTSRQSQTLGPVFSLFGIMMLVSLIIN